MRIFKRVVVIFLVLNLVRLFQSCIDDTETVIFFDFNTMLVSNIDNSGLYAVPADSDTMYSEAIAFSVQVFDSTASIYMSALKPAGISFRSCQAKERMPSFKPLQQIENISIVALYDISDDIPANTDVTQYFYFGMEDYSSPGDLYVSWNELYESMTGKIYSSRMESFSLYLTKNVENGSARFIISMELSDGRFVSDTTALIHIVNQVVK